MSSAAAVYEPLASPEGAWAAEHLASDVVGWLTTVAADGRVQPSPLRGSPERLRERGEGHSCSTFGVSHLLAAPRVRPALLGLANDRFSVPDRHPQVSRELGDRSG